MNSESYAADAEERCEKKPYTSKRKARLAHARAGWRVRLYWCDEHQAWHVANGDRNKH